MTEDVFGWFTSKEQMQKAGLSPGKDYTDFLANTLKTKQIYSSILERLLATDPEYRVQLEKDVITMYEGGVLTEIPDTPEIIDLGLSMHNLRLATEGIATEVWRDAMPDLVEKVIDGLKYLIETPLDDLNTWIIEKLKALEVLPEEFVSDFSKMVEEKGIFKSGTVLFLLIFAGSQGAVAYINQFRKKTERKLNEKYQADIPDYNAFMRETLYNQEFMPEYEKLMREWGIPNKWYPHMKEAARSYFGMSEIMTLKWRNLIDESQVSEYLTKAGFIKPENELIQGLFEQIPGIQDLISMAVREAWRDDVASQFGLDEEYPAVVEEWVKKQGYSPDWLRRYWRAHWTLPSVTMGYEMLHRRIIDRDTLELLLKTQDIPTFWRTKLMEMSYNPLTRVDVRRMYTLGVLDRQGVYEAMLDLGYNDKNATLYTEYVIRSTRAKEKDLTKAEILKSYNAGILSDSETEDMLAGLGYDKQEIEVFIALEEQKKTEQLIKRKLDIAKQKYVNGDIDTAKVQEIMSELEIDAEIGMLYIQDWDLDKLSKLKAPTKADLSKWLKLKIITEEDYKTEMSNLGYRKKHVENYIKTIAGGEEIAE